MNRLSVIVALLLTSASTLLAAVAITGPDKPTAPEKTAVAELKHYLDASLRQGLELDGSRDVVFHVGNTEFARQHRLDPSVLSDDQYVMCSVGNQIVLVGGGSRGTLYAVYRFLEDYLKIHWWTSTVETVPVYKQALKLEPFNRTITPAFVSRNIFPDNTMRKDSGQFAIRNRLNSFGDHPIAREYGGAVRFGSPDSSHTFDCYIPVKDYMHDHPDYFSLLDGKRVGGQFSGQLCLTNPEVAKLFIGKIKEYILKDEALARASGIPAPTIYDVSQNDVSVLCQCPDCKKVIAEEGANSGLILRFVNQAAAAVKEFRPDYWVSTLAYMTTEYPPKITRPLNNVVIRLCNTSENKASSIWAPEQTPFRQKVTDWQEVSAALYLWEYSVDYGPAQSPYPSEYYLSHKLNFYKAHNVKFMFMEHEFPEKGDMFFLKTWLETKLLEDPSADSEALIRTFMNGFYGPAGPHLQAYRELLRDSARRHNSFVCFFAPKEGNTYLDLDTITRSFQCFDRAEKAAHDDPALLARVRREKFNLRQAVLVRYPKLTGEWLKGGRKLADFPWPKKQLFEQVESQWKESINTHTVEKYRPERLSDIDAFRKTYANLPEVVVAPKRFAHWTKDSIDLTIDQANPHNHPLVADPESEAGLAVFVDLSKTDKKGAVPLNFGAYCDSRAKQLAEGVIAPDQIKQPGYNYYYCMTVTPEFSEFVYFLWDWRVQFPLNAVASRFPNQKYKVYVSAKLSGGPYPHGSKSQPWGIFIDRCVLVPCSE